MRPPRSALMFSLLVLFLFFLLSVAIQAQGTTPPATGEVNAWANVRSGPGTDFSIVGSLNAGAVVDISACNEDCTWYQIGDGQWIAAFLVTTGEAAQPTAQPTIPSPAESPTVTATATTTATTAVTAAVTTTGTTTGTEAVTATDGMTITLVSWNVESGGARQEVVAERLGTFQDVDIWGLSEVDAKDADAFELGAEEGEGADYDSYVGTTGVSDRLMLIWDALRFTRVDSGQMSQIGQGARAPLWVQLRENATGMEFMVMVNHLHQTNANTRQRQATMLNAWAADQTLPVVAMGDYNFGWSVEEGEAEHDAGYDNMIDEGVWRWVQPAQLTTTQCTGWPCASDTVRDFFFVAGPAQDWNMSSEIVVAEGDFPEDSTTPDHRPVMALISPSPADAWAVPTMAMSQWSAEPVTTTSELTSTSAPTATSVISAAPAAVTASDLSAQEQSYADFFINAINLYSIGLGALGNQFTAAGQNSALFLDELWTTQTISTVVTIQELNQAVRARVAPARYSITHAELVNGANAYDEAMALLLDGVNNLDAPKFTAANPSILEGKNALVRAQGQFLVALATGETPEIAPAATTSDTCPQANTAANLRSGPGTDYDIVGSVQQGQCLVITGRTEAGDWYQLNDGNWIAAFLVDGAESAAAIPVAESTPAPVAPTATSPAPPQATPIPSTAEPQEE